MIQIYDKTTTSFSRNGRALHEPLSCYMDEELNGKHEVELDYPIDKAGKWTELVNGNLVKADGQVYRIYNKKKSLVGIRVNARHLFYDNLDNFLEDVRPENLSGVLAAQWILARTQYPNLFTVSGSLGGNATRYFIRKNVVEAFMGETGIINTWGGEIEHDNYNIILHSTRGLDRGVHIRYGKNILGIEETLNLDDVCTRMMPIGKDGLLLPEKYIDSPYLVNYPYPKIKTFEFSDADTEEALRTAAQDLMDNGEIDIPKANYKVDFIELSKTEEYKNYAVLERVYLGDVVTIKHSKLGFDLKARVIKVRKNILTGRNENLELGYFLPNLASSFNDVGNVLINMAEIIKSNKTLTQQAIDEATHLLTTAIGGYVTKRNGELLIMDTEDPMTATKVWRYNLNGFGYSKTGINGPYELAITMDGTVVAGTAFFNSIVTNLIQSDIGSSLNLSSNEAIIGLVEGKAEKSEVTQLAGSFAIDIYKAGTELINQDYRSNPSAPIPIDNAELWHVSNFGQLDNTYAITILDTKFCRSGYIPHVPGSTYYMDNDEWYTSGTGQLLIGLEFWDDIGVSTIENNGTWYFPLDGGALTPNDPAQNICKYVRLRVLTNWGQSTPAATFIKGLSLKRNGQGTSIIGTSYRFDGQGFAIKDSNGSTLITPNGMANEQNQSSVQNVEDGYPLNMSFRIGDTTSVIEKVELRLKQYNFRTDSKGAASGGGSTSGPSSRNTSEAGASPDFSTATQVDLSYPNEGKHYHMVRYTDNAHSHNMAHTHIYYSHEHTVKFGILEYTNDNGTIEVDINGVRRTGTTNTDIVLDITTWVTTNGIHNISLRSPNLKRIQCDLYIKSYIRR